MQPAPRKGALPTALWALRNSLWPVPIHHWQKTPIGKRWGARQPTRESLLRLFDDNPGAGVGLLLGPASGVVDLEIDDAERAAPFLDRLSLPETMGWSSARGTHLLFSWDRRLEDFCPSSVAHLEDDAVELRVGKDGKQLVSVCPPSVGDDRRCRRWNGCWDVAPLPSVLLKALEKPATAKPKREPRIVEGTHRYAAAALRYEANAVRSAKEGTRNRTLNKAAFALGQLVAAGLVERRVVEIELLDAGLDAGLGEREVLATIKSGIEAGLEKPRR